MADWMVASGSATPQVSEDHEDGLAVDLEFALALEARPLECGFENTNTVRTRPHQTLDACVCLPCEAKFSIVLAPRKAKEAFPRTPEFREHLGDQFTILEVLVGEWLAIETNLNLQTRIHEI